MLIINVNGISGLGKELIVIDNPTRKIQTLAYTAHLVRLFKTDKSLVSPYLFAKTKFYLGGLSAC